MNNTILIILTIILLITIFLGLFTTNGKIYEGMVIGAVTPPNTTPTDTTAQSIATTPSITTPSLFNITLVYSDYFSSIIGVIDQKNNPVDYNNNIIGSIYNSVYVIDGNGNTIGYLIDNYSANMTLVIDEQKNIIGFFLNNKIVRDGIVTGIFDKNGALHNPNDYNSILGFSSNNSTPSVTTSIQTPFVIGETPFSFDQTVISDTDNKQNKPGLNFELTQSNSLQQTDTTNVASFNYDSLYNTDNMTPKYSFMNSSFLYKSSLLDENDYLNEIYFNRNPLEMETVCKKLDNETCGLTSSCVYVGDNKCVPGNKKGPYTTYSDINLDYYYYRGKCYGNCPGQFGTNTGNRNVATTTTSKPATVVNTTKPASATTTAAATTAAATTAAATTAAATTAATTAAATTAAATTMASNTSPNSNLSK